MAFACLTCGDRFERVQQNGRKPRYCTRECAIISVSLAAKPAISQHSLFSIWSSIIQRCENKKHPAYRLYGGNGVTICPRWRSSFRAFIADIDPRPSKAYSIDRFPDRDGNYEPGNVRWATRQEQSHNLRSNKLTEDDAQEIRGRVEHGETRAAVARRFEITPSMVSMIISNKTWVTAEPAQPPLHQTKLNKNDVREIIESRRRGEKGRHIAARFNISPSMVTAIVKGRTWKEVDRCGSQME